MSLTNSEINPISCESCRQKKCKCDRILPFCSQCAADPSRCIYPESGKRGLPLGYLTQLENRLEETEAALYSALSALHSINPSYTLSNTHTQDLKMSNTKPTKMNEWRRLPLTTGSHIRRWFEEKGGDHDRDSLDRRQDDSGNFISTEGDMGSKAEELARIESTVYF